jgi:methylated-DNA-[protein]-cysteine S-methyltransferase
MMATLRVDRIASPIGTIVLIADGSGLCALDFADYEPRMMRLLKLRYSDVTFADADDPLGASSRLREYLAGRLDALDDLPVAAGGTPFQQLVWTALREIPAGTTTTYGKLAERLSKPTACRAVGLANGSNPVAIVVPCHRVIGAGGDLTGYGGGLERKRWLLGHEGVILREPRQRRVA